MDHTKLHGITELLKQRGERITQARLALLKFLCSQTTPVPVRRLERALPGTNIVTLYRMLDYFVDQGIVHALPQGKERVFELADPYHAHHHHLICRRCGRVRDVECQLRLPPLTNFIPEQHIVTIYGHCKKC